MPGWSDAMPLSLHAVPLGRVTAVQGERTRNGPRASSDVAGRFGMPRQIGVRDARGSPRTSPPFPAGGGGRKTRRPYSRQMPGGGQDKPRQRTRGDHQGCPERFGGFVSTVPATHTAIIGCDRCCAAKDAPSQPTSPFAHETPHTEAWACGVVGPVRWSCRPHAARGRRRRGLAAAPSRTSTCHRPYRSSSPGRGRPSTF